MLQSYKTSLEYIIPLLGEREVKIWKNLPQTQLKTNTAKCMSVSPNCIYVYAFLRIAYIKYADMQRLKNISQYKNHLASFNGNA